MIIKTPYDINSKKQEPELVIAVLSPGGEAMSSIFEICVEKVISAIEAAEYDKAAAAARDCIGADAANPEGYFYLGEALVGAEKSEEAILAYEAGLKLAPEDTDALTALGDIYFELGRHKDALRLYQKTVEINPEESDGFVNIGLVYNGMERAEDAIKAYDAALKLDPENVFAYNALGDAWYGLGNRDKAIEAFNRGIAIDPNDSVAHFNLGELYYDLGEHEDAERECLEAIRLDPEFTLAYLTLGSLHMDSEHLTEAVKYLKLYLKYEKSPHAQEMIDEVKAVIDGLKAELAGK